MSNHALTAEAINFPDALATILLRAAEPEDGGA